MQSLDAMNAVKDLGKAAVEIVQSIDTTFEQMLGSLSSWKGPSNGQVESNEPRTPSVRELERIRVGCQDEQDRFDNHGPTPRGLVESPHWEHVSKGSLDLDRGRASNQPR